MDENPKPASDWQELLRIAQGSPLLVERVRIPEKQIAIEGQFSLPELARRTLEDQVFIIAFLRSHGSIKEMEQVFGVSHRRSRRASTALPANLNSSTPTLSIARGTAGPAQEWRDRCPGSHPRTRGS